ncbi:LAGLIDADG family homing endonuclease [Streptomyces sp. ATE26]|uniref:LAGLIDADG family homing endonuclease n=1 Tax=Streptomyces sp. ATE26 TaxID=2954237 RepID=UPI0024827E6E|nr:LAGLIDADG family homing endonuclease [Streptomyces sp. ATE26]MDI1455437.1 LAGLIDADG family homing endonuclease [Streptomyces sp. ATE26]
MAQRKPGAHGFMDLRTPEYAYMFGFLQADGHLSQGAGQKGSLSVELSVRDVGLLRMFQRLTPYYSSITERTRSTNYAATHTSATWTVCSLEARTTLNALGLPYGRKSKTIAPPLGEFSHRDYLRGLIDADGSVGFTSKGLPFVSLTTASSAMASFLRDHSREVTGAERSLRRNTRDDIYNVLYTMEPAQRLAADLYRPGCLSLERKRKAAESLAAWKRPAGMRAACTRRRWTEAEDRVLLSLDDAERAAEVLGRTIRGCGLRLWRLRTGQGAGATRQ